MYEQNRLVSNTIDLDDMATNSAGNNKHKWTSGMRNYIEQEKGDKNPTKQNNDRTPIYGNARMVLPLLILFGLILGITNATSLPVNIIVQNSTNNPALTFPITSGFPACANTLGGTCIGNDVINGAFSLTSNLYVFGNVIHTSGTMLSNGFTIVATNQFNGIGGTIYTGNSASTPGVGTNSYLTPGNALSLSGSYGGSGGGGGGGTNTGGSGSSPAFPTPTASLLESLCTNVATNLGGASGGAGGAAVSGQGTGIGGYGGNTVANAGAGGTQTPGNPTPGNGGTGGQGSSGICIIANTIEPGTVNANGTGGHSGTGGADSSGGGAGGVIAIVYGTGGYTAGTYNVLGGQPGPLGTGAAVGGQAGQGNVVTLSFNGLWPLEFGQIYPIKIYNATTSAPITYTVNQIFNGISTTISNANTLSYVPPANQPGGVYQFNVTEFNGVAQTVVQFKINLNMQDMSGQFTYGTTGNTLCQYAFQYNPNCVVFPFGTGNVFSLGGVPSFWNIQSPDRSANQKNNQTAGQYNIAQFSNALTSFKPSVQLCYQQFAPTVCFIANAINNPTVASNIILTQYQLKNLTTGTSPSAPYTRNIIVVNGFNESSFNSLAIQSTYAANFTLNNYTFAMSFATPMANSIIVYAPLSNYQNPVIQYFQQAIFSSNSPSYIGKANNLFNSQTSSTQWQTFSIYLAPSATASLYGISAFQCSGFAVNDYIVVLKGTTGAQTQTQQFFIATSSPFSIPLLNGNPYQFQFVNSRNQVIYTSAISVWTSPITLYLPCGSNFTPITFPNITTACASQNAPGNQLLVTCTGRDTNNLVNKWTVNFINQTTLITAFTMNSQNITGASFTASYTYPSNNTQYKEQVIAHIGSLYDPIIIWTFISGPIKAFFLKYGLGWVALFLVLLPLVLAYFHRTAMLLIEVFVIIIGQSLGLLPFTAVEVAGFIILASILILIDYRSNP